MLLDKRLRLALIVVCATVVLPSVVNSVEVEPKLVKNLAKLNEFLEKHVNTDDLEANVNAANDKLKSTASLLFDGPLKEALGAFVQLPLAIADSSSCRFSFEMLEHFDARLNDKTHQQTKNYRVGRVERILATVAYKSYKMCRLGTTLKAPEMKFAFKQQAYDQINDELVRKEKSQDPEANMRAAEEILNGLDNKEGSYARALEQFLSLKTILTEESCTEQGMEIFMKNALATRNRAHNDDTADLPRIVQVVKYYSIGHRKICHPIYMEKVLPHANELDLQTFKRVLALIGGHWFTDDLDSFLAEVEIKDHVGLDFTTPLLEKEDKFVRVASYEYLDGRELLNYMKAATAKQEPQRSKFLALVLDRTRDGSVKGKDRVVEIYDEYIIKPCEKFINVFESDMRAFNYNFKPYPGTVTLDLPAPLNFRLLSSAFNTCRSHINNRLVNRTRMLYYA